ncbi:hypothetical protein EX30DRAFT_397295 [Ascodesmis nigricans]|uniref:Uncharacterized protein n=1 Tax=Ascodesmis nigricans TaxID=341454 RepID=A0A4S2MPN0_9PEZI|nr:hypothetical protein EX30DRAFT_397295 [Ascodesmis nigricans]
MHRMHSSTFTIFATILLLFSLPLGALSTHDRHFQLRLSNNGPWITLDESNRYLMIGGPRRRFVGFNVGGHVISAEGLGGLYAAGTKDPLEPPHTPMLGVGLNEMRITENYFHTSSWAACNRGSGPNGPYQLMYGYAEPRFLIDAHGKKYPKCVPELKLEVVHARHE